MTEAGFYGRIASMFRGADSPDDALVRACLASYRGASPADALRTDEDLQRRSREHTDLVGTIVELGHRLGLRCWASHPELRRPFRGGRLADLLTDAELDASLPLSTRGPVDALSAVDAMWYVRGGRASFLFEVEWTAMIGEPVLRRGARIPTDDSMVRFLVVPPERVELVRFKIDRSPLLREALERDNWHIARWDHLAAFAARETVSLGDLGPYLGLDPEIERTGEQLPLFS